MRTALTALLVAIPGYLAGAGIGALAMATLSSNTHDKAVETAMTAIFVAGPAGCVLTLALWLLVRGR